MSGAFYDKLTDQIQVTLWFGAISYAAYVQSNEVLPVFLAFFGVAFYSLRSYVKYVTIYTEMSRNSSYLEDMNQIEAGEKLPDAAGLGFGIKANVLWFLGEQRKIFDFNEGVFIFILSFALVFDWLTEMLWIFAASQIYYGLARGWQRGRQIEGNQSFKVEK